MAFSSGCLEIPLVGNLLFAGGEIAAFYNPEGMPLVITDVKLYVDTPSTGGCNLSAGCNASATTADTDLINALAINGAITGVAYHGMTAYTNEGAVKVWAATEYITVSGSASSVGFTGRLFIDYILVDNVHADVWIDSAFFGGFTQFGGFIALPLVGTTAVTGGAIGNVANPEGVPLIIVDSFLVIGNPSTGGATLNVGLAATTLTSDNDLMSAFAVNGLAVGSTHYGQVVPVANAAAQIWGTTQYLTASSAQDTTGFTGVLFVRYIPVRVKQ